jgi:hypothetical protein
MTYSRKSNHNELASESRWIATFDFKKLIAGASDENIKLNLAAFTIPEVAMTTATQSFQGKQIQIPAHVNETATEITFDYLLSSDFHQYEVLYRWFNTITKSNSTGAANDYRLEQVIMPITVYGLSAYSNPIFACRFNDCFIKSFGPLSFDYTSEDNHMRHTFTVVYTTYDMAFGKEDIEAM